MVDVGDGIAAAIRIESHNHPSAIEPYQGAATGVGGILRDVFTMGARPIALMDSLRVGPLDEPRSRWILEGVVAGVSGYGNAVGVPTVGGEVVADATYAENPLVNVLCLGPAPRRAPRPGTGLRRRATWPSSSARPPGGTASAACSVLASAGFGGSDEAEEAAKRPSVQVGDPFEEKRLIEACLTLLDAGLVVGIQDLGGAGLACATSETASRGGVGMDFDVSAVPRREPGMTPAEVMTSESQERMLAIVRPDDLDEVLAVCRPLGGPGHAGGPGHRRRPPAHPRGAGRRGPGRRPRRLAGRGRPPLRAAAGAPAAGPRRARRRRLRRPRGRPPAAAAGHRLGVDAVRLAAVPEHRRGPGGDAAVLRLKHPTTGVDTGRALAVTVDGNQRWCAVDAEAGTALTVAEGVLNLACVGARPMAVVDCLNLGNPEHPEVMHQLAGVVDGMAEACRALGVPVVGGNVSLYNESRGRDIDPTPVLGTLGVVDRLERRPPGVALADGDHVLLVGPRSSELGGSRWAATALGEGRPLGPLPELDLRRPLGRGRAGPRAGGRRAGHGHPRRGRRGPGRRARGAGGPQRRRPAPREDRRHRRAVLGGALPGGGGRARGGRGRGRAPRAADAGVPVVDLGTAGGDRLVVDGLVDLAVADVVAAERDALPAAMAP